jgi:hypothetical protein
VVLEEVEEVLRLVVAVEVVWALELQGVEEDLVWVALAPFLDCEVDWVAEVVHDLVLFC